MRIRERFNPRAPCGARLPPRQAPSSMPYFNPCAPCGARRRRFGVARAAAGFQPTRPLRGATPHVLQVSGVGCISTHAPLAGRDRIARTLFPSVSVFQPTRPLRGATVLPLLHDRAVRISTHAPLAGRDSAARRSTTGCKNFNPRAPCGARQQKCTNHYAHFCDNRQISDAFTQNAACQGILLLFDAGKPCGFWVRTAQVISAHLCFAL